MLNALSEFTAHVFKKNVTIKCATINYIDIYTHKTIVSFSLPIDWTEIDFIKFSDRLNFRYDDGYGGQALFGTIWYTDGTWSTRDEYDGSEWWQYHKCPEIKFFDESPDELTHFDGDESDRISY